jgi:hypothetical protein
MKLAKRFIAVCGLLLPLSAGVLLPFNQSLSCDLFIAGIGCILFTAFAGILSNGDL